MIFGLLDIELEHMRDRIAFIESLESILRALEGAASMAYAEYLFAICEGVEQWVLVSLFGPEWKEEEEERDRVIR